MKKIIALALAAAVFAPVSGSANPRRDEPIARSSPMSRIQVRFQARGPVCDVASFAAGCRTRRHCVRGCDAIFEVETLICAAASSSFAPCFAGASRRWRNCIAECEEEFPY